VVAHNSPDVAAGCLARVRKLEVDMYKYELDHSAAHVDRVGYVFFVPFVFLANIDNHRVAAFRLRHGVGRRNFGDLLFRVRDQFLETLTFRHNKFLTTNRH